MTQTVGPATIRTHARRVYADPDGILTVPPRKAKDQRRHEHFDQLMQELQRENVGTNVGSPNHR